MASKFLNDSGLSYFWSKIKALVPTKISDVTNDSQFVTEEWVEEYVAEHTQGQIDNLTIIFKQENGHLILSEASAIPSGVGVSF